MAKARFDWDEKKNHENQRKHGVSFEFANWPLPIQSVSLPRTSPTATVKSGITVLAGWGMES